MTTKTWKENEFNLVFPYKTSVSSRFRNFTPTVAAAFNSILLLSLLILFKINSQLKHYVYHGFLANN